ncbi:hypothetical protein BJ742DRAFT_808872 [Cladochytrium replicatum]|nr:hypothetical protein BJ742DRAFT_808872 [Cladochytrium replicatum]
MSFPPPPFQGSSFNQDSPPSYSSKRSSRVRPESGYSDTLGYSNSPETSLPIPPPVSTPTYGAQASTAPLTPTNHSVRRRAPSPHRAVGVSDEDYDPLAKPNGGHGYAKRGSGWLRCIRSPLLFLVLVVIALVAFFLYGGVPHSSEATSEASPVPPHVDETQIHIKELETKLSKALKELRSLQKEKDGKIKEVAQLKQVLDKQNSVIRDLENSKKEAEGRANLFQQQGTGASGSLEIKAQSGTKGEENGAAAPPSSEDTQNVENIVDLEKESKQSSTGKTDVPGSGGYDPKHSVVKPKALNTPVRRLSMLPSSSVWCTGEKKADRICQFRNLCWNPGENQWFIAKTNHTVQAGVPMNRYVEGLMELGSVEQHPYFTWNYYEVDPYDPRWRNVEVRYEEMKHFLFLRLHPRNIMHNLHDDALPMYHHLKQWVGGGTLGDLPFDLDNHRLVMMDRFEHTDSTRPLDYLSNHKLLFMKEISKDPNVYTCFRDAVVGVSRLTTWYQYGFRIPQGPIPGKVVNGLHVREVANWYVRRLGLPLSDDELHEYDHAPFKGVVPEVPKRDVATELGPYWEKGAKDILQVADDYVPPLVDLLPANGTMGLEHIWDEQETLEEFEVPVNQATFQKISEDDSLDPELCDIIVIMSRKKNRIILNEDELAKHLEKEFPPYKAVFVRNEDHSFEEQIRFMRRSRVVIGMHGSIMAMIMFCRRGTIVIEMFPYAVPWHNYTPYHTLANLPGMNLLYYAWENKWENNTVAYPNNPKQTGGLMHLSEKERQEVMSSKTVPVHLCCTDPYWLYRIYQDTIVHLEEMADIVRDGIIDSRLWAYRRKLYHERHAAATLGSMTADLYRAKSIMPPPVAGVRCLNGTTRGWGDLWAEWESPWTHADIDGYAVLIIYSKTVRKEYGVQKFQGGKPGFTRMSIKTGIIAGTEVVFWVRSMKGYYHGEYSKGKCKV